MRHAKKKDAAQRFRTVTAAQAPRAPASTKQSTSDENKSEKSEKREMTMENENEKVEEIGTGALRICGADQNDVLVDIRPDGSVAFGMNYTPEAAVKSFWTGVASRFPRGLNSLRDETLQLFTDARIGLPAGLPDGTPSELADIIVSVLYLCGKHDVDIEKAVKEKMAKAVQQEKMAHGGEVV
jgi:hypothetical protein